MFHKYYFSNNKIQRFPKRNCENSGNVKDEIIKVYYCFFFSIWYLNAMSLLKLIFLNLYSLCPKIIAGMHSHRLELTGIPFMEKEWKNFTHRKMSCRSPVSLRTYFNHTNSLNFGLPLLLSSSIYVLRYFTLSLVKTNVKFQKRKSLISSF